MGPKRSYQDAMDETAKSSSPSPYAAMFEGFRTELDEHHDRRERIVKASRDITAASKKLIFSMQRARKLNHPLSQAITKGNIQHWETIQDRYKNVSRDLQGLNAYRYGSTITHGNQEFMEALSFQHYIETQTLISYEEARERLQKLGGEDGGILLTPEDYVLGIFDMTGEVMRFAITAMATNGELPGGEARGKPIGPMTSVEGTQTSAEPMELDSELDSPDESKTAQRNILSDLRELRIYLETFEPTRGMRFADDVEKKLDVMQQSVSKVENGFCSLIIRGRERPRGWMPDLKDGHKEPNEIAGY